MRAFGLGFVIVAIATSAALSVSTTPRARVGPPLIFKSVVSGERHTCGLTADGAAYCWGLNPFGELGAQSVEECKFEGDKYPCSTRPLAVGGGLRFVSLAIGGLEHTCGITTEGQAYCWGGNTFGELGRDSVSEVCSGPGFPPLPCTHVPLPVAGNLHYSSVVAGGHHSCALTTEGEVYCWGINTDGQLGNDSAVRVCQAEGGEAAPCRRTPLRAAALSRFTALVSGAFHLCALDSRGTPSCWGWSYTSAPMEVPGARFESMSAGDRKTCGLTAGGVPRCRGVFGFPPFGDASRKMIEQPVPGGIWPAGVDTAAWRFVSLTVGLDHVCGIDSKGSAACWGQGGNGELGTGRRRGSEIPVPVAGTLAFASLSAGGFYTCGVTTDGHLYCWGRNDLGQLGDGSMRDRSEPTPVAQPSPVASP